MWHEVYRPCTAAEVAWSAPKVKALKALLGGACLNGAMRAFLMDTLAAQLEGPSSEAKGAMANMDTVAAEIISMPVLAAARTPAATTDTKAAAVALIDDDSVFDAITIVPPSAQRTHNNKTINDKNNQGGAVAAVGVGGSGGGGGGGISGPSRRRPVIIDLSDSSDEDADKPLTVVAPPRKSAPLLSSSTPAPAPTNKPSSSQITAAISATPAALPIAPPAPPTPPAPSRVVLRKSVLMGKLAEVASTHHTRIIALTGPTGCSKLSTVEAILSPATAVVPTAAAAVGCGPKRTPSTSSTAPKDGASSFLPPFVAPKLSAFHGLEQVEATASMDGGSMYGGGGGMGAGIGAAVDGMQRSIDEALAAEDNGMRGLFGAATVAMRQAAAAASTSGAGDTAAQWQQQPLRQSSASAGPSPSPSTLRLLAVKDLPVTMAAGEDPLRGGGGGGSFLRPYALQQQHVLEHAYREAQRLVQHGTAGWEALIGALLGHGRPATSDAAPKPSPHNAPSSSSQSQSSLSSSSSASFIARSETPAYFNTNFSWGGPTTAATGVGQHASSSSSSSTAVDPDLIAVPYGVASALFESLRAATECVDAVVVLMRTTHDTHSEKLDLKTWLPPLYETNATTAPTGGGGGGRSQHYPAALSFGGVGGSQSALASSSTSSSAIVLRNPFAALSIPSVTEVMLLKQMTRVLKCVDAEKKEWARRQQSATAATLAGNGSNKGRRAKAEPSSSKGVKPPPPLYDFMEETPPSPSFPDSGGGEGSNYMSDEAPLGAASSSEINTYGGGAADTTTSNVAPLPRWHTYDVAPLLAYTPPPLATTAAVSGDSLAALSVSDFVDCDDDDEAEGEGGGGLSQQDSFGQLATKAAAKKGAAPRGKRGRGKAHIDDDDKDAGATAAKGSKAASSSSSTAATKAVSKHHPILQTIAAASAGDVRQALLQLQWACLKAEPLVKRRSEKVGGEDDDAEATAALIQRVVAKSNAHSMAFALSKQSKVYGAATLRLVSERRGGEGSFFGFDGDNDDEIDPVSGLKGWSLDVPWLEETATRRTWGMIEGPPSSPSPLGCQGLPSAVAGSTPCWKGAFAHPPVTAAPPAPSVGQEDGQKAATTMGFPNLSLFRNDTLELAHATARLLTQKYTLEEVLDVLPSSSSSAGGSASSSDCPPHKIFDYFMNNMPRYFDTVDSFDGNDGEEEDALAEAGALSGRTYRTQLDSYAAILGTASLVDQWIPSPSQQGFLRSRDTLSNTTNAIIMTEGDGGGGIGGGGGTDGSSRLHDAMGLMGLHTVVSTYRSLHRRVKVPQIFLALRPPPFFKQCFPKMGNVSSGIGGRGDGDGSYYYDGDRTARRFSSSNKYGGGFGYAKSSFACSNTSYETATIDPTVAAARMATQLEALLDALAKHNQQLAKSIAAVAIGGGAAADHPLLPLTPYWDLLRSLLSLEGQGVVAASPEAVADAAPLLATIIFGTSDCAVGTQHHPLQPMHNARAPATTMTGATPYRPAPTQTAPLPVAVKATPKRTLLFPKAAPPASSASTSMNGLTPTPPPTQETVAVSLTEALRLPAIPAGFKEGVLEQVASLLRLRYAHAVRHMAEEMHKAHIHNNAAAVGGMSGGRRWGNKGGGANASVSSSAAALLRIFGGFDCIRSASHQPLRLLLQGYQWSPHVRQALAYTRRNLCMATSAPSTAEPYAVASSSSYASAQQQQQQQYTPVNSRFLVVDVADAGARRAVAVYPLHTTACEGQQGGVGRDDPHNNRVLGAKFARGPDADVPIDLFDIMGALGRVKAVDAGSSIATKPMWSFISGAQGCAVVAPPCGFGLYHDGTVGSGTQTNGVGNAGVAYSQTPMRTTAPAWPSATGYPKPTVPLTAVNTRPVGPHNSNVVRPSIPSSSISPFAGGTDSIDDDAIEDDW